MQKSDFRIVCMGTPGFAVASLRALVEGGYNVVAVVTMPDKPMGRHQTELSQSAVKQYAVSQGLPVLQPEKLKDETFLQQLSNFRADLQVVVAFRMLPEVVWNMPPHGTFNLHASLLPQYRGAAPINWAIINGETKTGVTTFLLDHEIDTGLVLHREEVEILDTDNAEDIHDKLMNVGAPLVCRTVDDIMQGNIHPIPQLELAPDAEIHHAPKIFKDTCRLPLDKGVKAAYDFVRGMSPYPAAWTRIPDSTTGELVQAKIYSANYEKIKVKEQIGTVLSDGCSYLKIALEDGYLNLLELQMPGKKRMNIGSFLQGYTRSEELKYMVSRVFRKNGLESDNHWSISRKVRKFMKLRFIGYIYEQKSECRLNIIENNLIIKIRNVSSIAGLYISESSMQETSEYLLKDGDLGVLLDKILSDRNNKTKKNDYKWSNLGLVKYH